MTFRFDLLLSSKEKTKEKTEALTQWLERNYEDINLLVDFANESDETIKATCIEAIEIVSKERPQIVSEYCFEFVTKALAEESPRVKWESAKVIANSAHLFSGKLDKAIKNLLVNAEHKGTVVRWSAALALSQIVKLKTKKNVDLLRVIESATSPSARSSIRKIYLGAIRKVR